MTTAHAPERGDFDAARDPEGRMHALLARHETSLLAYALRLLDGDLERARDLVQDVFLRSLRAGLERGEGEAAWLFRVCRNRALDLRAKARPELGLEADALAREAPEEGPLERLAAHDEGARLRAEVARLPERERELLHLKFEHGLSYQAMGEVLGLSPGNVGFLLHKALGALRRRFGDAREPEPRPGDGSARKEWAS